MAQEMLCLNPLLRGKVFVVMIMLCAPLAAGTRHF